MPYSHFTFDSVRETFQLETVQSRGLFSDTEPVEPSAYLTEGLKRNMPFAIAIGTEKAKSELLVVNVLVELCVHFDYRISLFSGIDFNVDDEKGLVGACDFLVSLSPARLSLKAPAILLVEAKQDNLTEGLGQCIAEMVAAQRFNAEKGNDIPCIYGTITTGIDWLFLKLVGQQLHVDMTIYTIERCDKLLGILASMVSQET